MPNQRIKKNSWSGFPACLYPSSHPKPTIVIIITTESRRTATRRTTSTATLRYRPWNPSIVRLISIGCPKIKNKTCFNWGVFYNTLSFLLSFTCIALLPTYRYLNSYHTLYHICSNNYPKSNFSLSFTFSLYHSCRRKSHDLGVNCSWCITSSTYIHHLILMLNIVD